jgi:hypothetical protein
VTRSTAVLAALLLAALAATAAAGDSPHRMTLPDGTLDPQGCPTCHSPDMGLNLSERETCLLCHVETTHGGSLEHLRASAAEVKLRMEGRPSDAVALPLAKDGTIYCGTCHLYHDPLVLDEKWLAKGWVPPTSGLAGAVRASVVDRWAVLAKAYDRSGAVGSFATAGTRQLRLPVEDGTLCKECHRDLP